MSYCENNSLINDYSLYANLSFVQMHDVVFHARYTQKVIIAYITACVGVCVGVCVWRCVGVCVCAVKLWMGI